MLTVPDVPYWKHRYDALKDRGRCVVCGKAFRERGVRCEDCKIKSSGSTGRWQKKRRAAQQAEIARLRARVAELELELQILKGAE